MIEIQNSTLLEKVAAALDDIERDEWIVGIRFENKIRTVGEQITDYSRSNEDRDDDRDFPEYGTEEYDEMEELDGISTWDIDQWEDYNLSCTGTSYFDCEHIYLIGCTDYVNGEDASEFIMKDAIVLAIIQ